MNIDPKTYLQQWADRYRQDLTENIMPFWMKHGVDHVNGGVYTCVNRDGSRAFRLYLCLCLQSY